MSIILLYLCQSGQVDTKGEPGLDLDPTAASQEDFLSREKAALGDDANQFASASDKFKPSVVEDGDDDLLGGSGAGVTQLDGDDMSQFTSSFPSIDTRNEVWACLEDLHRPGANNVDLISMLRREDQSQASMTWLHDSQLHLTM